MHSQYRFTSAWLSICVLVFGTCHAVEPTVKELVERLQSKNTAPVIDESGKPNFKKFAWDDQEAVIRAATKLLANMDEAWLPLIKNLDRDGYSVTIQGDETSSNFTAGDFSEWLLRRAIVAGYRDLSPRDDRVARKMHGVGFVPFGKFEEWCEEQNRLGRSLVDVQLEGCRWARDLVATADDLPEDEKKKSVASLDARIKQLTISRVSIKEDYPFNRDGPKPFKRQ
jgi:hypothetical protein